MDPSALIFVALAVAWAAYLLPQALRHHDQAKRSRSVERFSERMRVLARREPTSSRDARLVVTPGRAPSRPVVETKASARPSSAKVAAPQVSAAARRAAAQRAARRRRKVLSVILLVMVVVAGVSLGGLVSPWWNVAPAAVLVAWLVACRLMVKKERASTVRPRSVAPRPHPSEAVTEHDLAPTRVFLPVPTDAVLVDPATPVVAMPDPVVDDGDPSRWDLRPVTLPTYVSKPAAAQRSVRTIDLESTGVWTSGRTEVDAELARAAEAERKAERATAAQADVEHRATGS